MTRSTTGEPWRYVLSAGRTGTVFLQTLLSDLIPGSTVVHEPWPTRYEMMLANLRNDWQVGGSLLRGLCQRTRGSRREAARGAYVEINPFLCPMTDLLPDPDRDLHVVHMVREPGAWARSITGFAASERFRWAIDWVPLAKPYPSPRPAGWREKPELEKALWRWRWCNERIRELRGSCARHAVVHYEDLFSDEASRRDRVVTTILDTLELPPAAGVDWARFSERVNPAPRRGEGIDPAVVEAVCGPLARELGYPAAG